MDLDLDIGYNLYRLIYRSLYYRKDIISGTEDSINDSAIEEGETAKLNLADLEKCRLRLGIEPSRDLKQQEEQAGSNECRQIKFLLCLVQAAPTSALAPWSSGELDSVVSTLFCTPDVPVNSEAN